MEKSLGQLTREHYNRMFESDRRHNEGLFEDEGMNARECIAKGISIYQKREVKIYWNKNECLATVLKILRVNGQDTDENCILAERIVDVRLDNGSN